MAVTTQASVDKAPIIVNCVEAPRAYPKGVKQPCSLCSIPSMAGGLALGKHFLQFTIREWSRKSVRSCVTLPGLE